MSKATCSLQRQDIHSQVFLKCRGYLKVDGQNGNVSVLADIGLNAPIVDMTFHNGKLFVSHRYKVSTVDMINGTVKDIIVGLPTRGDHHVNQIAFSPDGDRLYFGIGSATNSGVVSGDDPANSGWLGNAPKRMTSLPRT